MKDDMIVDVYEKWKVIICTKCGGRGTVISSADYSKNTCHVCKGTGRLQKSSKVTIRTYKVEDEMSKDTV